jgi:hypothetical protein
MARRGAQAGVVNSFAAPMRADQTTIGVQLIADAKNVILTADQGTARSQQTAIGPSEYGNPCARRLAYKMLGHPATNTTQDPWARVVGTAVHAWLAWAFGQNTELVDGKPRYRVEQRVNVHPGLAGSADLLDRKLRCVTDWKIPGLTAVRRARKEGIGSTYRAQAHAYGVGYRNAGEPVDTVAVVMLPKAGQLDDAYVWTEALMPQVVTDAAERLANVLTMLVTLNVEDHPDRYLLIPAAESYCSYCSWFLPGGTGADGCPGANPQ